MSLTPSPNGGSTYSPGSTVNHPGYSPGTTVNPAGYSPASSTVNPAGYSPISTVDPGSNEYSNPGTPDTTTSENPPIQQTSFDEESKAKDVLLRSILMRKEEYEESQPLKSEVTGNFFVEMF